jgi:hypothetical protein
LLGDKIDLGINWSNYCKIQQQGINNLGTHVFNLGLQLLLIPYQMQLSTAIAIYTVLNNINPTTSYPTNLTPNV